MDSAHRGSQHPAFNRNYRHGSNDTACNILLCMRFDMCPYLVPVQTDYEKQVLHHLQNLQLGSPDDVLADCNAQQLFFLVAGDIFIFHMACVGNLCIHLSREILGEE